MVDRLANIKYFLYLCGRIQKECIMEAMVRPNTFTISVPKIDTKRFKGIAKAMGWLIEPVQKEKQYDITRTAGFRAAMDDVKNGRVTRYDSLQDFYKEMGL